MKRLLPVMLVAASMLLVSCREKEHSLMFHLYEYDYNPIDTNPDTVDFCFSLKMQLPVDDGLSKSERAAVDTMRSSLMHLLLVPYYVEGTEPDEALHDYCDLLLSKILNDHDGELDTTYLDWYMKWQGCVVLVAKELVVYSCTTDEWTGYIHPMNGQFFLLYDRKTGRLLEEEDIFDFTEENERAIAEIIQQNFVTACRKAEVNAEDYVTDIKEMLPNGNFEVRADELVYHYDPYELGYYNDGEGIEVRIPSYQLEKYMNKKSALYHYWFKH